MEIYQQTVTLSGCDFNGFPQLTKLEFVIDMNDYHVDSKAAFLEYLTAIHSFDLQHIMESR